MNKFALTVLSLAAVIAVAAGSGARTRTSAPPATSVNGATISPASLDPVAFVDAGLIKTPQIDFVNGGGRNLNWDGTSYNFIGPLYATGTVRAGTQYLNNNGGVLFAFGQATSGDAALEGQVADSAGNNAIVFGNSASMTAGMDRYITRWTNNTFSTDRSFVTTNGTYINKATVGTAASGTGITASYSGAVPTWLHRVTVINTALAAASTSDVTLAVTPANSRIVRVTADVTQVFTGGALSAMTVMCGNSAGGNQYLLANSVLTAQNTWGDTAAEVGAGLLTATWADFGTSSAGVPGAITVQCRFTCTGANCSAATQGSVTFYVEGVTYF